ncbi:MAG: DUF1553 domain-containing protein [Fuerstia sp.]|nr:DUF1553 domain-containing protein [Fuerstiella sp.]
MMLRKLSTATIIVAVLAAIPGIEAEQPATTNRQAEIPSFRNEIMAVLSKSGCNLGTCHGNQHGKGGLKLSLRGQDPDADFVTLTRQMAGRRANVLVPDDSLLLRKPAMLVPHEGGRRFGGESEEYRLLRKWIVAGSPNDTDSVPRLTELSVTPVRTTLHAPQRSAILNVTARFSDNSAKDVTTLTVFESSDPSVRISSAGVVEFAESDTSRQTSVTVRYLNYQTTARIEFVPERSAFAFTAPQPANFIDELAFAQLRRLQINPSAVCDDVTFLRRVFLDLTGLLPTALRTRDFLASTDGNKRAEIIDELLASSEFVDFQTLHWADLLRVEDKTLDPKGVEVFHRWIRDSIAADKPLNQFAAEIIASRGSTYTEPPSNFYRALRTPEERSESAAQVFLGVRLQCSKCHNHPFDHWTQDDYYSWTNFFARVDYKIIENKRRDENDKHEFDGEQIVFMKDDGNVKNPTTGTIAGLRFLGGGENPATNDKSTDRLQTLAKWLGSSDNRRFTATQANRIWFQLLGQGIVDPIDDFRSTNPASNPELLDALTQEFVSSGYRVRELMRLILNSQTYQLSSATNETNADDVTSFSHAIPQRLTAEQTLDAISQVLDVSAKFGGYPDGTRAVQLAGVRNGGHRYSRPEAGDKFMALFGKPNRLQTCECERTGETTLAQTMEMVSGELITELLRDPENRVANSVQSSEAAAQFLDSFWWAALSRPPTQEEVASMLEHVKRSSDSKSALLDIAWAVLNSNEFLLRR